MQPELQQYTRTLFSEKYRICVSYLFMYVIAISQVSALLIACDGGSGRNLISKTNRNSGKIPRAPTITVNLTRNVNKKKYAWLGLPVVHVCLIYLYYAAFIAR